MYDNHAHIIVKSTFMYENISHMIINLWTQLNIISERECECIAGIKNNIKANFMKILSMKHFSRSLNMSMLNMKIISFFASFLWQIKILFCCEKKMK